MKRIVLFVTLVVLLVAATGCAQAPAQAVPQHAVTSYQDIPGITKEEIAAIEALKTERTRFTYGVMEGRDAFILPDGSYAGFAANFCDFLSQLFGIDFVLDIQDWNDLVQGLNDQNIDFTGEMNPSRRRLETYYMSAPIAYRPLRLFATAGATVLDADADLSGLTIGFLPNTDIAASIRRFYDLPFTSVAVSDYPQAVQLLADGKIDAFIDDAVADYAFVSYPFVQSRAVFPLVSNTVAVATANQALAPIISAINKFLLAGGANKLYDLNREGDAAYDRYMLNESFTPEEKAYINDHISRGAAVPVGFEHDNYPISFYNAQNNRFEGVAVDILDEITSLTGLQFASAVTPDATWESIFTDFSAGKFPMVAQLLPSPERQDQFLFSAVPYAHSYYALMSQLDHPNLAVYQVAQTSVGILRGSAFVDIYHKLFPNNTNLVEYNTQNECLDALERGDVDLLMASEYMLLTETNYREKSGLKINIKLDEPLDSQFGFNRNEQVLCSIIDKAQQYVQTEIIEINWIGRAFDYSKRLSEERARLLTIFLFAITIVLIVTMFLLVRNLQLGKKLKELAGQDALTDIYNRRHFLELATAQMERLQRTGGEGFIAIFDLDRFKSINDTYGHLAGDKVLHEIAQKVKEIIRPYDLLGRYGGEEFVLFMPDIDRASAITAMERIRQEVRKTVIKFDGKDISISASFGVAPTYPLHDIGAATKYADAALYRAKKSGRNKVIYYEGETEKEDES